jgi:hypothetical protein
MTILGTANSIDPTDPSPVGLLTIEQRDLLDALEKRMIVDRDFPDYERVVEKNLPYLKRKFWDDCLKDSRFTKAMDYRGLGRFIPNGAPRQTESELTRQSSDIPLLNANQLKFIQAVLDPHESRPPSKILKEMELTTTTYQTWLKDPVFRDFYHARARELLGDYMPEVRAALQKRAAAGDIPAIKLALEITGEWTDKPEKDFNPLWFVTQILEILQRNVRDVSVLDTIANELQILLGAVGAPQPVGAAVNSKLPLVIEAASDSI